MTTLVVGASRGLGRGIAGAFAAAGDSVVALARSVSPGVAEVADATDPSVASDMLDKYEPEVLILVAGAVPEMRPLQEQTWESFSVNWHADVKIAFVWLGAALRKPLAPGSRVVVVSSGAALNGSPASGGYAGAKATQRFVAGYAQGESDRLGLGLHITTVMPRMTPHGAVGRAGISAYGSAGVGEPLTPEFAGTALVDLVRSPPSAPGYVLTSAGLQPV
ncbi:SDR family NAD(P)-dependent oxidoreductase [Nonomuraea sp. NPDC050556]|uniref:SDR family NAD(P)-dependent oxidoreductase n=1 Tax=Nonomuraea sp. NPDC050556 TaxID=3364369 RepID=UPI00378D54AC